MPGQHVDEVERAEEPPVPEPQRDAAAEERECQLQWLLEEDHDRVRPPARFCLPDEPERQKKKEDPTAVKL